MAVETESLVERAESMGVEFHIHTHETRLPHWWSYHDMRTGHYESASGYETKEFAARSAINSIESYLTWRRQHSINYFREAQRMGFALCEAKEDGQADVAYFWQHPAVGQASGFSSIDKAAQNAVETAWMLGMS
jgi:hypothetical protein